MAPRINYDFTDFEDIIEAIRKNPTSSKMRELKQELNSFFKDSTCKEVLYTNNTDKMFFGMCVMPVIEAEKVYDVIQDTKPYRITSYYLELDSKLFNPLLKLTAKELVAILLHEVGHIVNDTTPIDTVRKNIDVYLDKTDSTISITDSIHYKELLAYGIKDAIRKVTSLFERDTDDEIIADSFVVACGYGQELDDAFDKIISNSYNINKDVDNKIIVLAWVLRLYANVKFKRLSSIRALEKGKSMTASKLECREMDNIIRRLNRIDNDSMLEGAFDEVRDKYNKTMSAIKYKGIRSFEDDLFEYSLRVKNVNAENDALLLLHQINTRMAIIDDYVRTEKMEENDRKRWFHLYDKYEKLRNVLSSKSVYKDDYSRLYITYPNLGSDVK